MRLRLALTGAALALVGCALLAVPAPTLAATTAASTFDHFTTGFELLGLHRDVPCEACHVGGIFKGTPHDCFSCHAPGSRIGATTKPTSHILSGNDCAQCHTPFGWKPVAKFNHMNVLGTCSSCHNHVQSIGKTTNHIPTTAECSTCHLVTLPWKAANFKHVGVTGNCSSCHDNIHAPGKPGTHVRTQQPCETCHAPSDFTTFAGTQMNHAGIVDNCQACHETGMSWYGVTMVDRPTPAQDSYHPSATAPNGADCVNCHTGFNVGDFGKNSKPANHIPFAPSALCTSCHKSQDFSVIPSLTDIHLYAPSTNSNCAQCHGSAAASFAIPAANFAIVGLPTGHIPTMAACETCHVGPGSSVAATPVVDGASFKNSTMSHQGVTTCVSCHGPTVTSFAGITQIVVMPATSPSTGGVAHIPSSTACEGCHLGSMPSMPVAANATKTAPGTLFIAPAPSTSQIHAGVTTGCNNCHEANTLWMNQSTYPIVPAVLTGSATTQYTGFHNRPGKAAGAFTILDKAHPAGGDCGECHTNTNYFEGALKPKNHIPTAATAQCTDCHKDPDFSVIPSVTDIHAYAPSTTANCAQCHGSAAASFAIPAANFSIVGLPTGHLPTTAACESCHVGTGSSIAATPVIDGASFKNSAMNHQGLTTCVECHGPTVTTFAGITKIVVMPATSPSTGGVAHIPTSTACQSCHLGSMPSGLVPANATKTAPGTAFATPAPTTTQIHANVTSGCNSCHDSNMVWMDHAIYPIVPSALSGNTSTQYTGFHTRPGKTATTAYTLADGAHPTSGDCSECHSNTNYFEGALKPKNHIPTSATAQCTDCHKSPDFSVMPSITDIHAYAPSTTANCAQCHGSAAASFAIPAANFSIVGLPTGHLPTTAACESCHVGTGSSIAATPVINGASFKNSAMNHQGLTTCVGCHGPTVTTFAGITKIVVMPATSPSTGGVAHIPTSTACEACHLKTMPAGLVPANATKSAPGTLFATPAPTTAEIHAGVTTGCNSCHDSNMVWMDHATYPIAPTALTGNPSTQYTGFHTRPGKTATTAFTIADGAHPASGDCGTCHMNTTYFEGNLKPSNHIPTAATAQCTDCHKNPDFSVMPSLTDIHAFAPSKTTNCAQCHGSAAASFAIPAANFSIVGLPGNHVPTTLSCETCHVGAGSSIAATPVLNGATFKNSAMSHQGLTTCVGCHGPTITGSSFAGITKIVVMPPTSPMGANAHIPSSTACEACHMGSMPSGLVPANATKTAPGTAFLTPVPTTTQIHSGLASGCTSCHEKLYVWMGMNQYPIAPAVLSGNPATQYTGFQTRPFSGASTYSVADAGHPATGDCVTCHGTSFTAFTGQAEPENHIPTTNNTCSVCHTTPGNFAVYTTNMTVLHSAVSTACSTCHADGKGPFAGAAGFKIVQTNTHPTHIPITNGGQPVECSGCHKTVTTFSGTLMSHSAIGDSGTAAAGNACDACHETGFRNRFYGVTINWLRDSPNHYICGAPGTPTAPNVNICSGGGSDCLTGCHEHQNNIPARYAKVRPGTPNKQIQSTPAAAKPGSTGTPAAAGLPGGLGRKGFGGRVSAEGLETRGGAGAGLGIGSGRFDHTLVAANCISCHNGARAAGKPAGHPLSGNDCDRCHTTSAWKPAVFDHSVVLAGTCSTCHNAVQAPGKPGGHVMTMLSCDSCHYVLSWKPSKPQRPPTLVPPQKKPTPAPGAPRARGASKLAPPL